MFHVKHVENFVEIVENFAVSFHAEQFNNRRYYNIFFQKLFSYFSLKSSRMFHMKQLFYAAVFLTGRVFDAYLR